MRTGRAIAPGIALMVAAACAAPADGAFPGQNGPIAFERIVDQSIREVWIMEPDGSAQRSLTAGIPVTTQPAFSPDGTQIAFVRDGDIWVMNADGSDQRNVTNEPDESTDPSDEDPAFSPDGTRIVFTRDTNLNLTTPDEIFSVGVAGGKMTNLTQNGTDLDINPTFSPDGSKIAWVRNEHGPAGPDEIFVMNADGTNPVNLTNFGVENSTTGPDWSPDGSQIAFAHDDDIWTMDTADGSDMQDITASPMVGELHPAFSPDGNQIAFARDANGGPTVDEIFTLNPGLTNLTNSAETDFEPSWGPLETDPPETTLSQKPKKRSHKRRPRFGFEADEPASTFECKLDKRDWKPCTSPQRLKRQKPKRHRFRVRATDTAGNTDLTPAKHRWRVLD